MSYIEISNTLFRGQLRGATGQAKFKLTAQAINAVDTVNIAGNQVTYSYYFLLPGGATSIGATQHTMVIDIPDNGAVMEFVVYCHGMKTVYIDGGARPNRNMRSPGSPILPYVEIVSLAKGIHHLQLVSGLNGTSAGGRVLCRYLRRTGLDN